MAAPELRGNPYPLLRWLRENEPVHRTEAGFFLISRHADVQWALSRTGDALVVPDREEMARQFPAAGDHAAIGTALEIFGAMLRPGYAALRRMMSRDLARSRVARVGESILVKGAQLIDGMAERLHDGEAVDFHQEVSRPLTLAVFAELFGIDEVERDCVATDVLATACALEAVSTEALEAADAASERVESYFRLLIADRRRSPRDDLMTALVAAHDEDVDRRGDRLILGLLWVLWLTGFDSSAAGLDRGMQAILDHPDQLHWLRGDDQQAAAFVEEVLRYDSVILLTPIPRIAARDIEFGDRMLPAGAMARMVIAAANRDPSVFPDPDRFDPSRDNRPTLSMGYGPYYCNGAALVRAEMSIVLTMIHDRFPDLVAAGEPVWTEAIGTANGIRGLDRFPIRMGGTR
ncbi:cytochrome P450 [Pseudonocardia adelaidensis]|uniref:cytochrome P450 n=1 Tax=Pseudonocardia adelaidensis TaxID=648754 RepID=UPI0031EA6DB8